MINVIILFLITAVSVFPQTDTVFVTGDISSGNGNLNNAIQAALNTGSLSNTVFKLEHNNIYVLSKMITIPTGENLTIVADEPGRTQETSPPQIMWTSSAAVNKNVIFECNGQFTLKNIWLRYADTEGRQVGSEILINNNTDINVEERAEFEGVIFDYDPTPLLNAAGAVTIKADHFVGKFKNCYFKNCIDKHFRYYGRAVSFPYNQNGFHADSLIFENCTFANLGYVFSQEQNNYSDFVWFNHCTFINIAVYALESGVWDWLNVTNSIFVNTYMYGARINYPYDGGTFKIDRISDFGFQVPFSESDRHILFNTSSFYVENWLSDWMKNNPYSQERISNGYSDQVPIPSPMLNSITEAFFNSESYPNMHLINLYKGANPEFILPPTNIDSLKAWLLIRWSTNEGNINWAYEPGDGLNRKWPLTEDLAYTNNELKKAGMGNFPLGDLYHWWPVEYQQWKKQADYENLNILNALIDINSPSVPRLVSPDKDSVDIPVDSVTLRWNSASRAYNYEIQLSLNPSFSDSVSEFAVSDTALSVSQLDYYTIYYWRVRSRSGDKVSLYSSVGFFRTKKEVLDKPLPISPQSNSLDLPPLVELVCRKTPRAVQYNWQLASNINFSHIVLTDTTNDTTATIGPLDAGKKYYWRVQGFNPTGISEFSSPDSFSVMQIPLAPELVSPVSITDEDHLVTFIWHKSILASGYHFQISSDSIFSNFIVNDSLVSDTTFTLSDSLEINSKYFWRVCGINLSGEGPFSPTAYFNTKKVIVDVSDNNNLPKEYALNQNYPNPFNPVTIIKYSIPRTAHVSLKVYDVLGNEIADLVNSVKSPGTYKISFNGNGLASGIYFYRLKSGSFSETKKIILMK